MTGTNGGTLYTPAPPQRSNPLGIIIGALVVLIAVGIAALAYWKVHSQPIVTTVNVPGLEKLAPSPIPAQTRQDIYHHEVVDQTPRKCNPTEAFPSTKAWNWEQIDGKESWILHGVTLRNVKVPQGWYIRVQGNKIFDEGSNVEFFRDPDVAICGLS